MGIERAAPAGQKAAARQMEMDGRVTEDWEEEDWEENWDDDDDAVAKIPQFPLKL